MKTVDRLICDPHYVYISAGDRLRCAWRDEPPGDVLSGILKDVSTGNQVSGKSWIRWGALTFYFPIVFFSKTLNKINGRNACNLAVKVGQPLL